MFENCNLPGLVLAELISKFFLCISNTEEFYAYRVSKSTFEGTVYDGMCRLIVVFENNLWDKIHSGWSIYLLLQYTWLVYVDYCSAG